MENIYDCLSIQSCGISLIWTKSQKQNKSILSNKLFRLKFKKKKKPAEFSGLLLPFRKKECPRAIYVTNICAY